MRQAKRRIRINKLSLGTPLESSKARLLESKAESLELKLSSRAGSLELKLSSRAGSLELKIR